MLVVPIQPVPSQQVQCVLNGQNCQIAIYEKRQGVFVDLNANGSDVSVASLALNVVPLTCNYSGFVGNLLFVDTQGKSNPTASGLGSRFQLVYLSTAEMASLKQSSSVTTVVVTPTDLLIDDIGNTIYTSSGDVIIVVL